MRNLFEINSLNTNQIPLLNKWLYTFRKITIPSFPDFYGQEIYDLSLSGSMQFGTFQKYTVREDTVVTFQISSPKYMTLKTSIPGKYCLDVYGQPHSGLL